MVDKVYQSWNQILETVLQWDYWLKQAKVGIPVSL